MGLIVVVVVVIVVIVYCCNKRKTRKVVKEEIRNNPVRSGRYKNKYNLQTCYLKSKNSK